jgi:hypothetical protein
MIKGVWVYALRYRLENEMRDNEMKETWTSLDELLMSQQMLLYWGEVPLIELPLEVLAQYEISGSKVRLKGEKGRECRHGHLVTGANKGFRKSNGSPYCFACVRARAYCYYHKEMDFEEVANKYYAEIVMGE